MSSEMDPSYLDNAEVVLPVKLSEVPPPIEVLEDTRANTRNNPLFRVGFVAFLGISVVRLGYVIDPGPQHETAKPPVHYTTISGEFPSQLPEGVQEHIVNAGRVDANIYPVTKTQTGFRFGEGTGFFGSVAWVNSNTVVTAGHVLLNDNGQTFAEGNNQCENLTLSMYNPSYEANHYLNIGLYSASYISRDSTSRPDIGILKLPNGISPDIPNMAVSRTKPYIGEQLYFANYEPVKPAIERDPTIDNSDYNNNNGFTPLAAPAVYGGVFIGNDSTGRMEVLTGFKSYGAIYDANTKHGASGGEVLNSAGELVGISVQVDNGTTSANHIRNADKLDIKESGQTHFFSTSYVQPVTKELIGNVAQVTYSVNECPGK